MEKPPLSADTALERLLRVSSEAMAAYEGVRDETGQVVDLRLTLLNPVAERLFGRPSAELIGQSLQWLYPGAPDLFQRCRALTQSHGNETFRLRLQPLGHPAPCWYELTAAGLENALLLSQKDLTPQREREQFLDSLLATITCGVQYCRAVRDASGAVTDFHVLECNEAICRLSGIPRERFLTQTLLAIDPAGRESGVFDRWKTVVDTGQPARFEHLYADAGVWFDLSVSSFGEGVLASFNDITALKQFQLSQQRQAERLRAILDGLPIPVFVSEPVRDEAGRITDFVVQEANQTALIPYGYGRQQVVGKLASEVFPDDRRNGVFDRFVQVSTTGEAENFEFLYLLDGESRWLSIQLAPYGDECVISSALDVTALKCAEQQAHERNDFLRTVLDAVQEPLIAYRAVRDAGGRIVDFRYQLQNRANARLLGLDDANLLGRTLFEVFPDAKNDPNVAGYAGSVESGKPYFYEQDFSPQGIPGWYRVSLFPHGGDGLVFTAVETTHHHNLLTAEQERTAGLQWLIDNVLTGVAYLKPVFNEHGAVVDFEYASLNRLAVNFAGRASADDLLGRGLLQVFPGAVGAFERLRRVYLGGGSERYTEQFKTDGLDLWGDNLMVRLGDGVLFSFLDISDRMRAEEKARLESEHLAAVVADTQAGIALFEPVRAADGRITDFRYLLTNPTNARVTGRAVDEIVGRTLGELFPDTFTLSGFFDRLVAVAETCQPQSYNQHYTTDSLDVWIEARLTPLGDGVLFTYLDVTATQEADRKLRDLAALLESVLDTSPTSVMVVRPRRDEAGQIVDFENLLFNRLACELMGVTPGEVTARTAFEMNPALREGEGFGVLKNVLTTGQPAQFETAVGEATHLVTVTGFGDGLIVVGVDITENRRQRDLIERANAELQRSNTELEQFAYVASHDLQEPLRKITTFADRLLQRHRDQLGPEARLFVGRMAAAAGRMNQLVLDLLDYSRVTRTSALLEAVDLNAVLQGVLADLDAKIIDNTGLIEADPLPTLPAVRTQMRQLLQNLLSNALKFRRPGVAPHIWVGARRAQRDEVVALGLSPARRYHCLTVTDNGIGFGFEPAYSEKIFILFQRLHGRAEYEGTGIGLSIVRKIAENHGGAIVAEGRPGEGATFRVYLPA